MTVLVMAREVRSRRVGELQRRRQCTCYPGGDAPPQTLQSQHADITRAIFPQVMFKPLGVPLDD